MNEASGLKRVLPFLAVLAAAPGLSGSSLAPGWAWSENAGWVRITVEGEAPPQASENCLSGFIFGESVGWIHMGDGSPASGSRYSNASPGDYGVNRDGMALSGWAWGESLGWIDFDPMGLAPLGLPTILDTSSFPRSTSGPMAAATWWTGTPGIPLNAISVYATPSTPKGSSTTTSAK